MLEENVVAMLKEKILFMGTVSDNVPRVRPMKPYIDKQNNIWLVSHADSEKIKEIEENNKAELCTLGDHYEVLRLQGELLSVKNLGEDVVLAMKQEMIESLPQIKTFFSGVKDSHMVIYKFLVKEIILRTSDNELKSELNFKPTK